MTNRRTFLKRVSAVSAAALLLPNEILAFPGEKMIGIQLYTIRDLVNKDFTGTLKTLSEIGYNSLEAAGYADRKFYGYSPKEYEKICLDFGLRPLSSHSGVSLSNADQIIEDTKAAGMDYLVLPWIGEDRRKSADHYKALAEELNQIGEKCKVAGLKFGYHNHAFEFEKKDGQIPYDILLENTEPDLCFMQLDFYWMVYGGFEPLDYFEKYPGRFELWHIKDMAGNEARESTEIGNGIIDFKAIYKKRELAGMKYFFLEQEAFNMDPIESITISYQFLKTL
jgi:sugar phosphate isomerase/epimerase